MKITKILRPLLIALAVITIFALFSCNNNTVVDGTGTESNSESASETKSQCEANGHTWVDADCDTPKTCSVCEATEGEALGHTWVDADCDTPKTCSVCEATEGEALGHTWVDADCDTPKTCSVCEATEGEALGHTWVDATCDTPKTCSVCEATEGEALGHDEVAHEAKAPTCTEIGWDAYVTCKNCDYTTYEEKAASGHTWVDADCDTPKTCSVCEATEGEALGHDEVAHEAKAPTCTEKGWDAYVTCSRCDYTTYEEKAASGHTWVDADCDTPKTCSVCGATEGEGGDNTDPNPDAYTGKYKTYINSVYVNGAEFLKAQAGENKVFTVDLTGTTLLDAKQLNWGGWYIVESGTAKYVYTITDADGNKIDREYVGTDITSQGHIDAAVNYGLNAEALKGGSISTTFDLSGFEGKTVTVEVYSISNNGYKVLSTVFNNVTIAAKDSDYSGSYRTHYNYINVNGERRSNGAKISEAYTFDCKGFTLNTPTSMSTSGWFIAESGTAKYVYAIIDKDGNTKDVEYKGSDKTTDDALKGIAEGLGITVSEESDCRKGAGCSVTFDLTGYEGQTVTIKLYAVTNNGDKILSTVITNVTIAAAEAAE